MDVSARLTELAKLRGTRESPVVSVYLNTRWGDEHQRDRVRVFLKNEIRKARKAPAADGMEADLDRTQSGGVYPLELLSHKAPLDPTQFHRWGFLSFPGGPRD